jgi:hypothetical protein
MRPALALIFAAATWATTCRDAAPCETISPTLNVFVAEVLQSHVAQTSHSNTTPVVPIRMKTISTIYGKPPAGEFVYHVWATMDLRAGDRFYVEEDSHWQVSLRSVPCGYSGPFEQARHQTRIDYFRALTSSTPPAASLKTWVVGGSSGSLSAATVRLDGPQKSADRQTDARGLIEWTDLPAGKYLLSVRRADYTVDQPESSLAPIDLRAGACVYRRIPMTPRFSISGRAQTIDGVPAAKLAIHSETPDGRMAALPATTNEAGEFTIPSIDPGAYILFAGGRRFERSPYPMTWYPGVPARDLAATVSVGEANPHPALQFLLPRPAPTRTVTFKIALPPGVSKFPSRQLFLLADPQFVYSQHWSRETGLLTAVVSPNRLIPFRVDNRLFIGTDPPMSSTDLEIPAGNEDLTLPVQLQLAK